MTVRHNPVWTGGPNGTTMGMRIRAGCCKAKRLALAPPMHLDSPEKDRPVH